MAVTPDEARVVVERCYEKLLGRTPDREGLDQFVGQLIEGANPADIAISIALSEECKERIASVPRRRWPERYRSVLDTSGNRSWVFDAPDDADFDWMEARIIADGYYEREGVWSFELDLDKRVMAELINQFEPKRTLELGCAAGAVVGALRDQGVDAEGVDISRTAYDSAPEDTRDHMYLGDILQLDLPRDYDLVYGLDFFEHLNPNRLDDYLRVARARLTDDGWLFAVVPAFGCDEIFGEVFAPYLDEWRDDILAGRMFRSVFCDDDGYPLHGHLVGAPTEWWVQRFAQAGFARRVDVERPLHARFADHFERAPARRSFYVFQVGEAGPATSARFVTRSERRRARPWSGAFVAPRA